MWVSVSGNSFVADFSNGLNTMTFAGRTLVLDEGGSKLLFEDEIFDLGAGKPRLIISLDGEIREDEPASVAAR